MNLGASNSQSTGSNGGSVKPQQECPLMRTLSPIKPGMTGGSL